MLEWLYGWIKMLARICILGAMFLAFLKQIHYHQNCLLRSFSTDFFTFKRPYGLVFSLFAANLEMNFYFGRFKIKSPGIDPISNHYANLWEPGDEAMVEVDAGMTLS